MTRLGKIAAGALLMAGTAVGTTAVLTTPADARVVVGVGIGVPGYYPAYPYYGYPYYGYPYGYYGPYWGVGWGGWGWRGRCCWGRFGGRFGFHDRDGFRGFHGAHFGRGR